MIILLKTPNLRRAATPDELSALPALQQRDSNRNPVIPGSHRIRESDGTKLTAAFQFHLTGVGMTAVAVLTGMNVCVFV